MAIIPRVISNTGASGASVFDGSVYFDADKNQYLTKTFASEGNRRTFTWSGWVKRDQLATITSNKNSLFGCDGGSDGTSCMFTYDNSTVDTLRCENDFSSGDMAGKTVAVYRDVSGWYHVCIAVDSTQSSVTDGLRFYVNGQLETLQSTTWSQNTKFEINSAIAHYIASDTGDDNRSFGGNMSQVHFIDGQSLDASYFGYTDPLTNTWRPKKFSGKYTGEYPVADYTGGLPILATNSLGTAVTSGTRADSNSANIVLALPFNGDSTDYSATIKGSGAALVGSTDSITYPTTNDKYYGSSVYQNADGDVAWYITGESAFTIGTGAFTVECWVRNDGNHDGAGGANEDQYVWQFTDINMRVRMWKPSGGARIITFYTGDITGEPTVATVLDDEWHHIAVVREGTGSNEFKIYVDGALSYTGTDGTNLSSDKFMVGNYSTSADYGFSGNIQDVRVYTVAKYTSAFTVPPDRNLAAGTNSVYLPLDGNTAIGVDQSGKGNDWTLHHTGSAPLNKATGAFPILNTISGGNIASPKVRGQVGIAVTVYDPSGSQNRYYFDGIEAPSYNFSRGQNVTFDLSDSTVATHQLKFSTTSDGTHGGGSAYDDGAAYGAISAGTVGAATTITFPHNAQNTLYYYCVNHSGMGGSVGLNTDVSIADPYAWKNILAAPLNRSPTDYSNLVNCTATARTLTVDGPTIGSNNNFYNRSYYWDGSDDKITAPNSADFNLKAAGWTAECWARPQDDSDQVDLITYLTTTTGWYMFIDSNMKFGCGWQVSGGSYQEILSPANAVVWDKWQHFAAVCDSGTVKLYLNGILQPDTEATSGDSQDPGGGTLGIGWKGGSYPDWLKGNIQDARIYHVCKYTENFIPAATNPDILPDSPSGVAYSSELTQATDGAVTFGQEGGYMTVPEDADWDFGTGDYTAEAWVYMTGTDNYVFATLISGSWWGLNFWTNNSSWSIRAGYNSKHEYTGIEWNYRQWYHVAVARESGTSRLFLDGKLIDSQADTDNLDSTGALQVGRDANSWNKKFGGLISNARIVKGTAVYTLPFTPSSTPLTNITNTKLLCCQSKTSATAYAVSPGSITAEGQATASPFNPFDDDIDMVLGKSSNYCTLNPLNVMGNITLSDGNLHGLFAGSGSNRTGGGNVGVSTGSWYYEATLRVAGGSHPFCGFVTSTSIAPGSTSNLSAAAFDGSVWCGNGGLSTGDVVGNVLDLSGTAGMGVTYYALINGVEIFSSSSYVSGTSADLSLGLTWIPALSGVTSTEWELNFGQKPFNFLPPEGFGPLCTATNELPQIARPSNVVGVSTWLGTGADNHTINTGFQADLLWIKDRDTTANWYCFDSVRGRTQVFHPNLNNAESGPENNIIRNLSNKSGYILGQAGDGNNSSYNYVGYSWKAGGNAGTFNKDGLDAGSAAAAGVSGGSITPTACSVGTREGFSILKYEGTGNASDTIATGLDIPVDFYIVKSTDNVGNWNVASKAMGLQYSLILNTNSDRGSASADYWNSTDPTNTLISIGTADSVNADGWNFIVYAWANRPGLQKFGSYTGNGSATDGVYVELGFRPALLITKKSSSTSNWLVWDKGRSPYNLCNNYMYFNDNQGETTDGSNGVDFLSNGFKLYNNYTDANNDGADYIYMAWAESSFKSLYGAQSNAR